MGAGRTGVSSDAGEPVTTWHHGLVATWWATFALDGPEIEFFGSFVAAGQPALDVGCGTGRLLVPWVAAGLDVDGADASADMIAACRAAARAVGHEPALAVQPVHLLDLPRTYTTIVMCGAFGLGVSRELDLEGLRRLRAHLRPGGLLALDYEVGEFDTERWDTWRARPVRLDPPAPDKRHIAPDGTAHALRARVTAVDVDTRRVEREIEAWQWDGDQLLRHETHRLVVNVYVRDEIVAALGEAGFHDVEVVGGYHGGPPRGDERFLVYLARAG
jgi:SAM-dependent methyltransferase